MPRYLFHSLVHVYTYFGCSGMIWFLSNSTSCQQVVYTQDFGIAVLAKVILNLQAVYSCILHYQTECCIELTVISLANCTLCTILYKTSCTGVGVVTR